MGRCRRRWPALLFVAACACACDVDRPVLSSRAPTAPGEVVRALAGTGDGSVSMRTLAVSSDRIVIVGGYRGTFSYGSVSSTSTALVSGVALALDRDGSALWSSTVETEDYAVLHDLVLDGAGTVRIAGYGGGTLRFGGMVREALPHQDALFLAHAPSGALAGWSALASDGNAQGLAIGWDPAGDRTLVGGLYASLGATADLAGTALPIAPNDDGFLAAVSAAGAIAWARRVRSSGLSRVATIDVAEGRACVAGDFEVDVDVDDDGTSEHGSSGASDGWAARLGLDGTVERTWALGGSAYDSLTEALVVGGDCVVSGTIDGAVAESEGRVSVARLGGSGPLPIWQRTFSGEPTQLATAAARDAGGNVYVAGSFRESPWAPLDDGPSLVSAGGRDAFVAKLGPGGDLIWMRAYGGPGDDDLAGLAVAPDGALFAVGSLGAAAQLGAFEIDVEGESDLIVLELVP